MLAAAALAAPVGVETGNAAVSRDVAAAVHAQLHGVAKPSRASRPQSSRARSAMAVLEDAVVARMNQVRASRGLRPLRVSRPLRVAADFHSRDMAGRGYFEHDSMSGTPFWRRIERFYPSRGFRSWTVGENLLWGTGTYGAAFAIREWMNSPPHRENILSRQWREVGIGAIHVPNAPGTFRGRTVTIVTADFGARR